MMTSTSVQPRPTPNAGSWLLRKPAAALAAIWLVAFAASAAAQSGSQTIRMAVVKSTIQAPALAAAKYLPAGWKTELTYFTSPADMTNALLTDSVDLAYIGITVAVVARSKDQPIAIVANLANKGTAIIARADSSIRTIADLKGKRIGNLPTSIHDILLREELKKANLRLDEVTLIRLAPADMPAALQRGDIDAFSGNEPNSSQTLLDGYGRVVVYPYDTPVGSINVAVLTGDRVIKEKPDMLRLWAVAHAKATEELTKNPDEWADMVSKEWGYERASTRRSIDNIELAWRMDPKWLAQFVVFMDRLKELSVVTRIPELDKVVVREFVEQVKF
jgi:NitT/TauT family transport system substrate-binding protein